MSSLSTTGKGQDIPAGMCKNEEMGPEKEKERCERRREGSFIATTIKITIPISLTEH